MPKSSRKSHQMLKSVNSRMNDLPRPPNPSYMWNLGSLLGLCLMIQIVTGIMLAVNYSPHVDTASPSITHIFREMTAGWTMRSVHANGASTFFLCMYLHMARTLYSGPAKKIETWNTGVTIFILSMATAFTGCLLPWNQVSCQSALMITDLIETLPLIGVPLANWLWNGPIMENPVYTRFFTLHFILPFILTGLVMIHLLFHYNTGSKNPLGLHTDMGKMPFHVYYSAKNMLGGFIFLIVLLMTMFYGLSFLYNPENLMPANLMKTPTHIKPEWYFLWTYAILRSIPSKLGGVVTMLTALLVFYFIPPFHHSLLATTSKIYVNKRMLLRLLMMVMIMLTWIGSTPNGAPYSMIGSALTLAYFIIFFIMIQQCTLPVLRSVMSKLKYDNHNYPPYTIFISPTSDHNSNHLSNSHNNSSYMQ